MFILKLAKKGHGYVPVHNCHGFMKWPFMRLSHVCTGESQTIFFWNLVQTKRVLLRMSSMHASNLSSWHWHTNFGFGWPNTVVITFKLSFSRIAMRTMGQYMHFIYKHKSQPSLKQSFFLVHCIRFRNKHHRISYMPHTNIHI